VKIRHPKRDEWLVKLESVLKGPQADSYMEYVQTYLEACSMADNAKSKYSDYIDSLSLYPTWDEIEEQSRLYAAWARLERYERRILSELKALV
jgi:hypothetical protein